jgi:hypothetical protein
LVPALEGYIAAFQKQTGVQVEFAADGDYDERLPSSVETSLYRIVQEALTNVARHAHASRASVMLQRRKDTAIIVVEDNGAGFDVEEAFRKGRLGLLGIRERAEMFGGTLTIESSAGSGAALYISIPLEVAETPVRKVPDVAVRLYPGGMITPTESAAILPEAELARAKTLGDIVNNIIDEIASLHNPDLILERAVQRVAEALGSEAALVVVRAGDEWVVRCGYQIDATLCGLRSSERDFPQYLADVAGSRQVLVFDDVRKDLRFAPTDAARFSLQAAIIVPLVIGGEVTAVIGLNEYSHPRRFTPIEVGFVERLKELLSLVLDNARLRQQLEQRAPEHRTDLEIDAEK